MKLELQCSEAEKRVVINKYPKIFNLFTFKFKKLTAMPNSQSNQSFIVACTGWRWNTILNKLDKIHNRQKQGSLLSSPKSTRALACKEQWVTTKSAKSKFIAVRKERKKMLNKANFPAQT